MSRDVAGMSQQKCVERASDVRACIQCTQTGRAMIFMHVGETVGASARGLRFCIETRVKKNIGKFQGSRRRGKQEHEGLLR